MDGHMRDVATAEGAAIVEAFASLKARCEEGKEPLKDVAALLQTEKNTPSALMSGVRELTYMGSWTDARYMATRWRFCRMATSGPRLFSLLS
jgi:hypothetical protein